MTRDLDVGDCRYCDAPLVLLLGELESDREVDGGAMVVCPQGHSTMPYQVPIPVAEIRAAVTAVLTSHPQRSAAA